MKPIRLWCVAVVAVLVMVSMASAHPGSDYFYGFERVSAECRPDNTDRPYTVPTCHSAWYAPGYSPVYYSVWNYPQTYFSPEFRAWYTPYVRAWQPVYYYYSPVSIEGVPVTAAPVQTPSLAPVPAPAWAQMATVTKTPVIPPPVATPEAGPAKAPVAQMTMPALPATAAGSASMPVAASSMTAPETVVPAATVPLTWAPNWQVTPANAYVNPWGVPATMGYITARSVTVRSTPESRGRWNNVASLRRGDWVWVHGIYGQWFAVQSVYYPHIWGYVYADYVNRQTFAPPQPYYYAPAVYPGR